MLVRDGQTFKRRRYKRGRTYRMGDTKVREGGGKIRAPKIKIRRRRRTNKDMDQVKAKRPKNDGGGDKSEVTREEMTNGVVPKVEAPKKMGLRAATTKKLPYGMETTRGAEFKMDEEMETRRVGVEVMGP